jgi:hypothetical protein
MIRAITLLARVHVDAVDTANNQVFTVETGGLVFWGFEAFFALGALLTVLFDDALLTVLDTFGALFALSADKIMGGVTLTLFVVIQHKELFCITLRTLSEVITIDASNNFFITKVASVSVKDCVSLALALSIDWLLVKAFLGLALVTFVGLLALVAAGDWTLDAGVIELGVAELAGAYAVGVWLLVPEIVGVALLALVIGFRWALGTGLVWVA